MKKSDFQKLLDSTLEHVRELSATKGEEYANSNSDQLANFKNWSTRAGTPVPKVWMIQFLKHMEAVEFYVKHSTVLSESLDSRIDDAILYLILLKAIHHEYSNDGPE